MVCPILFHYPSSFPRLRVYQAWSGWFVHSFLYENFLHPQTQFNPQPMLKFLQLSQRGEGKKKKERLLNQRRITEDSLQLISNQNKALQGIFISQKSKQ